VQCKKVVKACGLRAVTGIGLDMRTTGWKLRLEDCRGDVLSTREWKKIINERVRKYGINRWKLGMNEKETLVWYAKKECPKFVRWYDGSVGSQLLFKARTQSLEVNARTYRWNEGGIKKCMNCDLNEDETVMHVMVECDRYDAERQSLLNVIGRECDDQKVAEWLEREDRGLEIILGIKEGVNDTVIEAVKVFLERVWKKRGI